jgi:hypothetical protein
MGAEIARAGRIDSLAKLGYTGYTAVREEMA